jgi:hypothetical protein
VRKALKAHEIAGIASELVGGEREAQHGGKADNFRRIGALWSTYLSIRRSPSSDLDPADVGHMMVLMKIARTQSGAVNPDDYIDAAGYAACAGEIALQAAVDEDWAKGNAEHQASRVIDPLVREMMRG